MVDRIKARIFIHHPNLARAWLHHYGEGECGWGNLIDELIVSVEDCLRIPSGGLDCRGASFYASRKPDGRALERALELGAPPPDHEDGRKARWLVDGIDQLRSITVKVVEERVGNRDCSQCGPRQKHWIDKGLDTCIALDLLSMASQGFYDVAVLVSDDEELVPAVEAVQDILDKKVIHAGFRNAGRRMRAVCWGNVAFDEIAERIFVSDADGPYDLRTTEVRQLGTLAPA
jgi:hypothetical protein